MVFGLEMVSALDLPQDAVFLLFFLEEAPQVKSHGGKFIGSISGGHSFSYAIGAPRYWASAQRTKVRVDQGLYDTAEAVPSQHSH